MERVLGIGGIFFKSRNPEALRAWYAEHLGLDVQPWGGTAFRGGPGDTTVWSVFPESSDYFDPSPAPFMVNYRVRDLETFRRQLIQAGCAVEERVDVSEFGAFGWVMDPDGNRIELWQPPAEPLPG